MIMSNKSKWIKGIIGIRSWSTSTWLPCRPNALGSWPLWTHKYTVIMSRSFFRVEWIMITRTPVQPISIRLLARRHHSKWKHPIFNKIRQNWILIPSVDNVMDWTHHLTNKGKITLPNRKDRANSWTSSSKQTKGQELLDRRTQVILISNNWAR